MQVLKFGGTSVANAENINKVVQLVREALTNDRTILVVSALGGVTDMLIQAGLSAAAGEESYKERLHAVEQRHLEAVKQLLPLTRQSSVLSQVKTKCNEIEDICNGVFLLSELSDRTRDKIVSYGELLSSLIISARFDALDIPNTWKDSRQLISTDSHFGYAAVDFPVTNQKIREFFDTTKGDLFILPGFIASDSKGITTTLGRGGSDYTAAILAAATDAAMVEIWTDVSGMMTADPRLVSNVKVIPHISYQEAMELSHFGAKVIYPPTIQPVMAKGIPVRIKNTFSPADAGTVIEFGTLRNGSSIRGISSIGKIALLSLEGSGMVGIPGFSKRLFEALSNEKINVILITQGSSEHSICVGVEEAFAMEAKAAVDNVFSHEIETGKVEPLIIEKHLSIVALVGDQMKSHPGVSGKMFGALGRNGVNVRAIAQGSSERNISAVIAAADVKKAINVLHEEFFSTTYKQVNLFITGAGNVGRRLIDQLRQQQSYLLEQLRLQVRVIGLANSRKMVFNDNGIPLDSWKQALEDGLPMNLPDWVEGITSRNLRNAVFADITANQDVAACYDSLLQKSISVVACNKIACSSPYGYYRRLKDLSREYNSLFLFETNVGAGLPVIGTLNDLLRSGDKVGRIEAVLSGTLNFVFNHYNGEKPFTDVVRQAQEEGYTEPDPRLDLSGTDVMRKIMILAREAGEKMEMEDIENNTFLPESCLKGSVEDFYKAMAGEEEHFKALYDSAAKAGKKLKFVARYQQGKASVGLQHIDPRQDLYHLYGKDNVVLFYTDRYTEQPLVIKGAGAGAEVTASGVFADIIRAARL
ncbi:bifunctional aspartate kinase/homoserine dehydrogenase I [Flavitalea sp. BT771]|uniref:bifunctional aspartate kinase/homoserine dehydrogenase I n=1 Tax=Flavitalea sp. BT771 TaxID=3063329 RepID=UPI0026E43372|nr:bifunctional aspartate kinase/homoserine dehydrogenase I [Flavitalea sp. BT771]MDO6432006.1 bifunctional aspartate kinase/homoserine dehydrogenase I [Flavitalea sp. BT771]MDV6220915.1 bifunctional aspartate kinase/homoserine dehydrogenase I [Flavitalea sp. BT771]